MGPQNITYSASLGQIKEVQTEQDAGVCDGDLGSPGGLLQNPHTSIIMAFAQAWLLTLHELFPLPRVPNL